MVANPVCFIAQKLLISGKRPPRERAKDVLYIHDTLELFGGSIPELRALWIDSVRSIMDNLAAHKSRHVHDLVASVGATVRYLPPYSYDLNPIEHAWALIKRRLRRLAPRTSDALRAGAQRARRVVQPRHCRNWTAHAGYTLK